MRLAPALAIALLAPAACRQPGGFLCTLDSQCEGVGEKASCEPNGACSFADPSCASGRRIGANAPAAIAGECVQPGELPDGVAGPADASAPVADAPPPLLDGAIDAAADAPGPAADAPPVDAEVGPEVSIPRLATPPTIDGDLGDLIAPVAFVLRNASGVTGTYRLGWDDAGLYLEVAVVDPGVFAVTEVRDGPIWQDDSLETCFDMAHDHGAGMDDDDRKFFVSAANTQGDVRGPYDPSFDVAFPSAAAVDGSLNDAATIDLGYTIEVHLPWSVLLAGGVPTAGYTFGLDVVLNDRDAGGSSTQRGWSNAHGDATNEPRYWGNAVLTP